VRMGGGQNWLGFGISGAEPLCSVPRELISGMDLREIGCEDGRWIELAGLWY
jgi:hypothetical protein